MFREREANAFLDGLADSASTQSIFLTERVVTPNAECDFGRAHDFAKIKNVDDYRRAVPIRDYESFRAAVERIDAGEKSVLTVEPTKRFFTTSGSTAEPKYIPVTQNFIRDKSRAFGVYWNFVFRDHPAIATGRIVTNFSDAGRPKPSPGGLPTSSESAYWASVTAATQRKKPIVPREVSRIADHDARYYTIARVLLESSFHAIMALNPSTILLMFRTMEANLDTLLDDVANGTLSDQFAVPDDARRAVEENFEPNLERAAVLRDAMGTGDIRLPAPRAFEDLELAVSWRSPMLAPYLSLLDEHLGDVAVRDYISMASEGILAIPLSDGGSGGALGIGMCFYELLPEGETETVLPHEAEVGGEYVLILTNRAGLYRYDIGDVVRVRGFEGTTPIVEFLHRSGRTSSLTGEKLTEAQVTAAVTKCFEGVPLESFTLAPRTEEGLPHYVLIVELPPDAAMDSVNRARELDAALGETNGEYRSKRESKRLDPPRVWCVEPGSYAALRLEKLAAGAADLQYKHTHLTRDVSFAGSFTVREKFRAG